MAYYESRPLLDVFTLDNGLLMTMAMPFASRQTAFTVYQAIVLPQPQRDEDMAVKWTMEAEYQAVSENLMETSLVTRDQVDKCIGSSKYGICHETLATESKCGCSPLIRKRVFKPHNEPYYMEIDIDPIEVNRLYNTLGKHSKSLKLESTFKDKLEEPLDYLEDEL